MTMISLIIKSYFTMLLSIGSGSLFIFLIGLYFILRKKKVDHQEPADLPHAINENAAEKMVTAKDLSAIAGDDMIATQLDLARAYIETGKLSLAKKILESAKQQGNEIQRKEATTLLDFLNSDQACNDIASLSRT